ncbi:MAG: hypothetical protein M3396_04095 [Actinomycetota bacterium]|nr:hypothetical protein [Actinomycetota bacterium]
MTEVISVEVDGEVDDGGGFSSGDRRPPRWGLPVAIAVAGVLLLAVLIMVVLPALTGADTKSDTEAVEMEGPEATAQEGAPAPTPADPRIDAAAKALAAWGQFAVTGDMAVLEGLFDKEGPQYQALMDEAPHLAAVRDGLTPYRVTLSNPAVAVGDSRQVTVAGTVVWSRQPEAEQVFAWEVVLRPSRDAGWVLWSVQNT